jgi:hypothetical protein
LNRTKQTLQRAGVVTPTSTLKVHSDYFKRLEEAGISNDTVESLEAFSGIQDNQVAKEVGKIHYTIRLLKERWKFETSKVLEGDGTWTIYVGKYALESKAATKDV